MDENEIPLHTFSAAEGEEISEEETEESEEIIQNQYDQVHSSLSPEKQPIYNRVVKDANGMLVALDEASSSSNIHSSSSNNYLDFNALVERTNSLPSPPPPPPPPPLPGGMPAVAAHAAAGNNVVLGANPNAQARAMRNKLCLGIGVLGAGAVVGAVATTCWYFLSAAKPDTSPPAPPPPPGTPPSPKETMNAALDLWLQLPEADFWKAVSDYVKQMSLSYPMQFDAVTYLAAAATKNAQATWTEDQINQAVRDQLAVWRKSGINNGQPLTADQQAARRDALYTAFSTLKDNTGAEASRYWKLRILSFVLTLIITPPLIVDDSSTNFSTVGNWQTSTFGTRKVTFTQAKKAGEAVKTASFEFPGPRAGTYEIFATWPESIINTNGDAVPYQLQLDKQVVNATVKQGQLPRDLEYNGVYWLKVGEIKVPGDVPLVVQVSNDFVGGNTGSRVVADSIMAMITSPSPDPPTV